MPSQWYTGERFLVWILFWGVIFPAVFSPSLCFFDGNITSKQKFLLSLSDSTCYTVFVLISVLSAQLSLLLPPSSSAAILNSALSLSSLSGHCTHGEFKVTLKYHTSCEVDHTCVWSQSLLKKKIVERDIPGLLPPFSVAPLTLSYLL